MTAFVSECALYNQILNDQRDCSSTANIYEALTVCQTPGEGGVGTKSQPLRMQSAMEGLGAQVKDDDKVWSLDRVCTGVRAKCSLSGESGKCTFSWISKAREAFAW